MNNEEKRQKAPEPSEKLRFADAAQKADGIHLRVNDAQAFNELIVAQQTPSSTAAVKLKPIDPIDARALPKFHRGLLIAIALLLVSSSCLALSSSGLPRDMWVDIPMQIYWTFCIFRLSQVMARRYGGKMPLSSLEVMIISLVSFACMPYFEPYDFGLRWLDPSFVCWVITQCYWIAKMGLYIERKEHPTESDSISLVHLRLPLILTLGTNAYLFLAIFFPALVSCKIVIALLWFASQFWCLLFLTLKLKGAFENRRNSAFISTQKKVVAGDDVIIRYQPFIVIERWIKERFSGQGMREGARFVLMWFVGPLVVVASVYALTQIASAVDPLMQSGIASEGAAAIQAAANRSIVSGFLIVLGWLTGLWTVFYLSKPTHIGFGRDGLRFLWRHNLFSRNGKYVAWKDLLNISIIRP